MTKAELQAKIDGKLEALNSMLTAADKAGQGLTKAERKFYDTELAKVDRMLEEKRETADMNQKTSYTPMPALKPDPSEGREINRYMSNPDEEKRLLGHYFQTGNTEYRGAALQKDIDVSGGFAVVPTAIHNEIMHALDNQVFIRKLAKIFKVDKADSVGVPIMDDDISDPDWLSEISEASLDSSMDFEQRRLSPTRLAKAIKVSRDLLHLSTPDMADFVINRGVYKLAVAMENAFLNGNGVNRPLGLFTASAHGINTDRDVSDGNDATSIKTDGLINALYSLKAQYIQSPACRWIFHRDAIKQVRKLKDGEGNYLWSPSIANDRPATILGVPYVVSEYCPNTFTSGSYVGLVGDLRFYGIAEWNETQVLTLNEKYALENAVGYVFQAHCDGMPLIDEAFARVTLA